MRQWRPRLEEINREARQFGVGVRGGLEQVALRARVHHEARNWLILTDCSNAFNTVKKTAMLAEAAITHAIHRKMIRREARPCILPNGFGGAAKDGMFQRSATRGRHGPGVVLHVAATSAEADP